METDQETSQERASASQNCYSIDASTIFVHSSFATCSISLAVQQPLFPRFVDLHGFLYFLAVGLLGLSFGVRHRFLWSI
jgi:hypothetical protein